MYSYEIERILKEHNYNIPSNLYLEIINTNKSPQIVEIKYNGWDNNFYVRTNDNYNWNFKIYKEEI